MMDIKETLLLWFTIFFYKKTTGGAIKSMKNQQLANELHKPIIKKLEKKNQKPPVFSSFIDNIWGTDLADMQLISKFNKGSRFLLCGIDIYSKKKKI